MILPGHLAEYSRLGVGDALAVRYHYVQIINAILAGIFFIWLNRQKENGAGNRRRCLKSCYYKARNPLPGLCADTGKSGKTREHNKLLSFSQGKW